MDIRLFVSALLIFSSGASAAGADSAWVPLAGPWRFALDPNRAGLAAEWFRTPLPDTITLPGTTDEARKGQLNEKREPGRLTRLYPYAGAAWYQHDIDVPAAWTGRHVTLVLERTKRTRLWVDQRAAGEQNSLVAPHLYDLGELTPGRHQLTLCISNDDLPPIGDPHQISDHTQTNWNGAIGRIGLRVTGPVWIEDVRIDTDRASRRAKVRIEIGRVPNAPLAGTVRIEGPWPTQSLPLTGALLEADIALPPSVKDWDEFTPTLNPIAVTLDSPSGSDRRELAFGLREFKSVEARFRINGRLAFLRGEVDNCVFPLTGYPPMDVEGWRRVFRTAREYGINHYRFHSWCPPEAAFAAADELGIYLQPELPNWAAFGGKEHDDFLRAEGERILRAFGNHPSFVMLSLGNELGGRQNLMQPFVDHFRSLDARHLYAQGTNNWFPQPGASDDYWTTFRAGRKSVRGSFATVDPPLGHILTGPANTLTDYSDAIAGLRVPLISHEIAQYQVAPDFREIERYTGVLRARNFELFRERMQKAGLLDQADAFFKASGAQVVQCYREDIEAALRTPGFGGFQLLDLQDFPGQGTALVGILNAFLESKGLITPKQWREFCSETVPLARFSKYTWTRDESFDARFDLAHYGAAVLNAQPEWVLRDSAGRILASGRLPAQAVTPGSVARLGEIKIAFNVVPAPSKVSLVLSLAGTDVRNAYDLWVYPGAVAAPAGDVLISHAFDSEARRALAAGRRVLLLPDPAQLTAGVPGQYAPDFWNYGMFKGFAEQRKMPVAPGTLGILVDDRHPALHSFPTESHGNWQWFELIQHSRSLPLDTLPAGYRPVVQVIDNYERAQKFGVLFEMRVGSGRLMVVSMDLTDRPGRPEARQLLHSILAYMRSPRFNPQFAATADVLGPILRTKESDINR